MRYDVVQIRDISNVLANVNISFVLAPLKFAEPLQNCVINSAETAQITCKLMPSELPYKISWRRNKTVITNGDKYQILRNGDNQTLEIKTPNVTDSGEYTCVATCILGTISCTANITVLGTLTIYI